MLLFETLLSDINKGRFGYNGTVKYNDSNYPNIDHKISIYYGYCNGYTVSELSDISNLCITKRWINIKKGIQCSDQFNIRQNIQDNDICITYTNI